MGIRVDFLIKHVRPYGTDAFVMLTTPGPGSLTQWLLDNNVPQQQINFAYNLWASTTELDITPQTLPQFVQSAQIISEARWSELYPTSKSTIMFLNQPLIKELSYRSQQYKGQAFEFAPYEVIPLAVTILKGSNQGLINQNVTGANLASDSNGLCYHFDSLVI
ncbi:hypothetical protein [Runella sp.]|uniref:hypothetical protein n=1 Tax=Runella sp. TaxID=1960881 RepID=UPI003D1381DC